MERQDDYYENMNKRIGAVMVAVCAIAMSILFIVMQGGIHITAAGFIVGFFKASFVFVACILIFHLWGNGRKERHKKRWEKHGWVTKAKSVRYYSQMDTLYDRMNDKTARNNPLYTVTYEYYVGGKAYKHTYSIESRNWPGEITVWYNGRNPKKHETSLSSEDRRRLILWSITAVLTWCAFVSGFSI